MLFSSYRVFNVSRMIFDGYFLANFFFSIISLFGFFWGTDLLAILSAVGYFGVSALLSLSKIFRKSPFALLLCSFSFQFLNIPITFILVQGQDYIYGTGLASVPYEQVSYQHSLPVGILYLTCFWVATWLAIVFAGRQQHPFRTEWTKHISLYSILLMGFVVMIVTWMDNNYYADIFLYGGGKETSWLAFIFFDHAYLVLAGVLLFCKLNEIHTVEQSKKISVFLSLIYAGAVFVYFMAGSKAAILVMFNLLILYPFCVFMGSNELKIQFLKPAVILFFGILAIPLFYFALVQRFNLGSGIPPTIDTLIAGIFQLNWATFVDTIEEILYRFSQGGIDRYLLIFQSFIVQNFDFETSQRLIGYLLKSILNLLLPGTPFPEAYVSSSQLFPEVIANGDLNGNLTLSEFIHNSNTQPYTLFGIFILLFGVFSPLVLFLVMVTFVFCYNRLENHFLRMTIIYFSAAALSSFGIDSVIGNSAHLLVSIVLMYVILRICTYAFSFNLYKTFRIFN